MEKNPLIDKLKELQKLLSTKPETHEKDSQTNFSEQRRLQGFNILPKKIIRKIFLFTDFLSDGSAIYSTCRLFNSVMRSRTYQILLHNQYLSKNSNVLSLPAPIAEDEIGKLKPESEIKTKEDAVGQLRLAESIKSLLVDKLKRQDNKNVDLEKEIKRIQEEIKSQKNLYSKGIEKMNDLDAKTETEKKILAEAQKNLQNLENRCRSDIENLKTQIKECEKDREKLLLEKKSLRTEVLELRKSNITIQEEIIVYQEALNKIKAYFEAMEEANLLKLPQS